MFCQIQLIYKISTPILGEEGRSLWIIPMYTSGGVIHYPSDMILENRDKATKISLNHKNTTKPMVFITTYNQNTPNIENIITKH